MADRCRDLLRVAVRDDLREQLQKWAHDLDPEAEAMDNTADGSALVRRTD